MNIKLAFLVVFNLVAVRCAKANDHYVDETSRRYNPAENDPYRIKYLAFQDENGKMEIEDITVKYSQPRAVFARDVVLHLYTQQHPTTSIAFSVENPYLLRFYLSFNSSNVNYFIIHGWKNDFQSSVNLLVTKAILEKDNANVFVVDWSIHASQAYPTSKSAVRIVAQYLANFINHLIDDYKVSPTMFRMVGHSLGAHIAGCAGAALNGTIDYIIGLDPAAPLFTLKNRDNRLDKDDAKFVQVIHTNADFLGFSSSIGHADYYPNDGFSQPGCGFDWFGMCAHSRSYRYYAESIRKGGFTAKKCTSYKEFKASACANNEESILGTIDIDTRAHGDYYLDTHNEEPFALGKL